MPGNQRFRHIGALSTELRQHKLAAGIEPATSRLKGEVTQIFTTGKLFNHKSLPGNRRPKFCPLLFHLSYSTRVPAGFELEPSCGRLEARRRNPERFARRTCTAKTSRCPAG